MINGLLRDFYGISTACGGKRAYSLFFDWIYPDFFPILHRTAEAFANVPDVMASLMKFLGDFVHNKYNYL